MLLLYGSCDSCFIFELALGTCMRNNSSLDWFMQIFLQFCSHETNSSELKGLLIYLSFIYLWKRLSDELWQSCGEELFETVQRKEEGSRNSNFKGWVCWRLLCPPPCLLSLYINQDEILRDAKGIEWFKWFISGLRAAWHQIQKASLFPTHKALPCCIFS